jgi:sulfite exporter TauE/SafE
MSETHGPNILRSLGAVVAGLLIIFALSLGTDVVMHATGVFPPWFQPMSTPLWMFAFAYRSIYAVLGCYMTARLAPSQPLKHALLLGVMGVLLSLVGLVSTWNAGPEFGPKWYPLALVASSLPCAWLGGKLRQRQTGK